MASPDSPARIRRPSHHVLRGLYLEAHGYKVRVTEFTGFEHTQKNEMTLRNAITVPTPARERRSRCWHKK
jgi:hypothetical protein